MDCLHDEASERSRIEPPAPYANIYALVQHEFYTKGCGLTLRCSCTDGQFCKKVDNEHTLAASAMYELLGDDIDGAAAMLEDMGLT
jgi:hypothetical protein